MAGTAQAGELWRALASPHRRRLLDLLREGPRTTGELARAMPQLSRFGVMQHLGVLTDAGLVLVRREGRQRFNYLNAVPLREMYERWVNRFAGEQATKAVALRRHMDKEGVVEENARAIRIETEIRLDAPRDRVWRAITDEQQDWYPYSYGRDRLDAIIFEHHVGGRVYEDWGGEAGHLYGTVYHYDPPRAYCTRGYLHGGITLEQWATLEADGDQTILKQSTVTFGAITEEMAEQIRRHGDLGKFEHALRAWVERDESIRAGA